MTQYFDNFSADSIGAPPSSSRWTPFGFASTSGYKVGNVVDIGGGTKGLRIVDNGWGNASVGYTRTELGTYSPGGSEAIEIVAKFRFVTQAGFSAQAGAAGGVQFGHYSVTPYDGTRWWETEDIGDYLAGTSVFSLTCAMDTWYWVRFRRESTGVFKCRIWADGASEPGSWDQTSSADTTFTSGGLGPFSHVANAKMDFALIGIGTGGDPAPTTDGPPPVTPVLMGQIVM